MEFFLLKSYPILVKTIRKVRSQTIKLNYGITYNNVKKLSFVIVVFLATSRTVVTSGTSLGLNSSDNYHGIRIKMIMMEKFLCF